MKIADSLIITYFWAEPDVNFGFTCCKIKVPAIWKHSFPLNNVWVSLNPRLSTAHIDIPLGNEYAKLAKKWISVFSVLFLSPYYIIMSEDILQWYVFQVNSCLFTISSPFYLPICRMVAVLLQLRIIAMTTKYGNFGYWAIVIIRIVPVQMDNVIPM